ncbi:Flavohemoprotein [Candida viswanathii]|jgi:nitric oxide dioxygenase|uniref:nitric oxide dioxygenase n=1 Tax=Candida viswanathii TaxID=5486 RepID=A0A367XUY7_9ASCO|nr:Flavohemoprotein [Candida viswanathii]
MTVDYQVQELTPAQIKIIKDTVPILEQAGETLTAKFYNRMLTNYDEVKPFFNVTDQKLLRQPKILAFALLNYAKNIENLAPLTGFVQQIVSKHVGLQVKAEHYPIVGTCLIETMIELLPAEIANKEFLNAWGTAYGNLAKILIDAEAAEYAKEPWDGFKDFRVTKIVDESADVKSVYFTPADGSTIPVPKRGQYVCFRWQLPGHEFEMSREYSISEFPKNNELRISVRHVPEGLVSGYIHKALRVGDILKVAPPNGNFVYEPSQKNLVLLAGGIGITPLVSIIEAGLQEGRNVKLLYSNRTPETRAFGDLFKLYKEKYGDKFQVVEFFSDAKVEASNAIEELHNRGLTLDDLDFITPEDDVYLLGPRGYMKAIKEHLGGKNIDYKLEYFGPLDV